MSLLKNRKAEASTHWHNLSGRDSESERLENESSPTDTLDMAETSEIASPNYSKRLSGEFKFSSILIYVNFVSILPDLC